MGEQDCPISDALCHSRQRSGILTPASESSLNNEDGLGSNTKKRKRVGDTLDELLNDAFIIKPHPPTVFVRPRSLLPIALIARSDLPLSSLDNGISVNSLPECRLFESHVRILELEDRIGNAPVVLIARLEDGRSHYAVELESRGLYTLVKLGSWVDPEKLCRAALVRRRAARGNRAPGVEQAAESKQESCSAHVTSESTKYSNKKRLAIEAIQSMIKRPSEEILAQSQLHFVNNTLDTEATQGLPAHKALPADDTIRHEGPVQRTAAEILDSIRTQYLEALYLSKASLAYFAKGPLSRARAAFHLDYDSTLDMKDLIEFLESLILSTTLLDKKYRDSVSAVISAIDFDGVSNDEAQQMARKRKKGKKMKLGKNGLYPMEDTFIRGWWQSYDAEEEHEVPGLSRDEVTRKRITRLRIRETQLQMIVILETLGLAPLITSHVADNGGLPSADPQVGSSVEISATKAKKPLDMASLIDVHIDRLCIWQTVASEENTATKRMGTSNVSQIPSERTLQSNAADVLREFCVEVIVPFFSGRLPEQCAAISRKLGGPVVPSPARPKISKSASISNMSPRPGAVTQRPTPGGRSGRSLRRVLTDERHSRAGSRGPLGAISLMRSATGPTVPGLKREASETPSLGAIPTADFQSLLVNRGGVLKSKKFSQREVDLSTLAQATVPETKNKKAIIEAELKEAISALKRPNRQLAGKMIAETAERRISSSASLSRKSKKPVQNPLFQGVQILATPKVNRQKDMTMDIQQMPGLEFSIQRRPDPVRPSGPTARAAYSVTGHGHEAESLGSDVFLAATPARSATVANDELIVDATPMRSLAEHSTNDSGVIPASSPLQARRYTNSQNTEIAEQQYLRFNPLRTPTKREKIHATPMKSSENTLDKEVSTEKPLMNPDYSSHRQPPKDSSPFGCQNIGVSEQGDESIYKALGWDDDDDELA